MPEALLRRTNLAHTTTVLPLLYCADPVAVELAAHAHTGCNAHAGKNPWQRVCMSERDPPHLTSTQPAIISRLCAYLVKAGPPRATLELGRGCIGRETAHGAVERAPALGAVLDSIREAA